MDAHVLTLLEDPFSNPTPTPRSVTGEELKAVDTLTKRATLVVQQWPEDDASEQAHGWAFDCWPGPLLFAPRADIASSPPNFSRIILASSYPRRVQPLAEWVAEMAARAHSHVYLLVTLDQDDDLDEHDLRTHYQTAQERLAALAASLRLLGVQAHWEVRFGVIGEEVAGLAATTGTNVVAIQRPEDDGSTSDFARVFDYFHRHGPRINLLVGPADLPSPLNGRGI